MQIIRMGMLQTAGATVISLVLTAVWGLAGPGTAALDALEARPAATQDDEGEGDSPRDRRESEEERTEGQRRDRERGERRDDDERGEREGGDRDRRREGARERGDRERRQGDRPARTREGGGPALAHMVFFDVVENSEEARERLVAACKEYLSGHRGTIHFSVGVIAGELKRDVNDQEFDVALHLVFRNRAAHDQYQTHPRHLEFIEKHSELWERVRVFDSFLSPMRDRGERRERDAGRERERARGLPEGASGFAGMVRGRVRQRLDGGRIVLEVSEVTKVWDASRARNPNVLAGRRVLIVPRGEDDSSQLLRRFLGSLPQGEEVVLDVAHRRGPALTLVELTEEQRRYAGRLRRDRGRDRER